MPLANVTGWGDPCFIDDAADATYPTLTSVLGNCNLPAANYLMLACRRTGADVLSVLAWAPSTDVLFDTGGASVPHVANGVGAWRVVHGVRPRGGVVY